MDSLILASASPDRAAVLRAAGFTFQVVAPGVEDDMDVEETPDGYVRRMAMTKCDAVRRGAGETAVLGAASVVMAEGRILGRPATGDEARRLLRMLSAREHVVMTAVCLNFITNVGRGFTPPQAGRDPSTGSGSPRAASRGEGPPNGHETGSRQSRTRVERTVIELAALSDAEVEWYVRSGEPMRRAGGFSVQGLGSRFARRIEGSPANAMGMPVAVVYELCVGAGMKMT